MTQKQDTVLVVGSGGREHALAWRLLQSPLVCKVLVAPGNGGTAEDEGLENIPVAVDDFAGLAEIAKSRQVALTVIGPEMPLAKGIVDYFKAQGLACFGPNRQAAKLEASKTFAKQFLQRHHIATAAFASFEHWPEAADYIRQQPLPVVIKADGLAAGKGVVVAQSLEEALNTAESMLTDSTATDSPLADGQRRRIVVEECLTGDEISFIVIADGQRALTFSTSQDHKRAFDGDLGPNTGGMGAYSPVPLATDKLQAKILRDIINPTLAGMASEGTPYVGFLYAGLMITAEGIPKVIEFNCRFGDPEAQPVLLRLQSDLYPLCQQAIAGQLQSGELQFDKRPALGVVMATRDYPADYPKGLAIQGAGSGDTEDLKVFHAGTQMQGQQLLTAGGRVLCVTALGNNLADARKKAYSKCNDIRWDGVFYRKDIGHRAG